MRLFLLFFLALPVAAADESAYRYENPIIFQRQEVDPSSGKTILNGKLWVMESDGSHLRQVTFGDSYDEHPSVYSDREHVLYSEFPGGKLDLHQGGSLIKLHLYNGAREIVAAEEGCALHHASLSPFDDLIAYHYNCGKRFAQALEVGDRRYETEMAATNGVRTRDGIIAMHEKNRGVAPREVALAHIRGRGRETTVEFLTDGAALHRRPAISPDGKLLAWQTNAAGGEDEIFLANVDGSNPRNLTEAQGDDGHPWFARDGEQIVFESNRSGNWEIWILDRASGQQKQLTNGKGRYQSTRPRM